MKRKITRASLFVFNFGLMLFSIQKKQFNCTISTFLFVFMGTVCAYSQSYQQSQLINKEWVGQIPGNPYRVTVSYTDKIVIQKMYISDEKKADGEAEFPYYLSDKIVDTFQDDLVGKGKSGRYIVVFLKPKIGKESISMYEILEITETTLKIKHLQSGSILTHKVE